MLDLIKKAKLDCRMPLCCVPTGERDERMWHFISPKKKQVDIVDLVTFADANDLSLSAMRDLHNGKQSSYRGWTRG